MENLTRRSFLKLGAQLAAALGLTAAAGPALAEALAQITSGARPVLWLQGQSCSGCSISLLDGDPVTPDLLLTQYISLAFHQTLSGATGNLAIQVVNRTIEGGGYVLVVEGAVPLAMPSACRFGDETFADQLSRAARRAQAVIAVGSCASWGGIPAADNNPTGAVSVPQFLDQQGIATPRIRIPGCPAHPDWLIGTVAHVVRFGLPALDGLDRPKAFYGRVIHDQCPRFADYEREHFAQKLGDPGCLFKLGCQGPVTRADCNIRQWNSGTNTCIKAGAPCVGCAWEKFAAKADYPFYLKAGGTG